MSNFIVADQTSLYNYLSHGGIVQLDKYVDRYMNNDNEVPEDAGIDIPADMLEWLTQLRLLYGIPFNYLVPRADLLPRESIRFFYIDRNWTDRLVDGALSVGKIATREYAHHQALNPAVIAELDKHERLLRHVLREGSDTTPPETVYTGDITGFLLRSSVVSRYPGMEIKAYPQFEDNGDPVDLSPIFEGNPSAVAQLRTLRIERLAPNVLICLFAGIPKLIRLEEPREGIQFGVDGDTRSRTSNVEVKLRNIKGDNAGRTIPGETVDIPFRNRGKGVVNIAQLAKDIGDTHPEFDDAADAAQLATQLLQFPYVQNFTNHPPNRPGTSLTFEIENSLYQTATFPVRTAVMRLDTEEINLLLKTEEG
jgi:hypothetical protein